MSNQHHTFNRSLLRIVCKTEATGNMIADRLEELERENAKLLGRLDSVQKSHFSLSKDYAALRDDKARLEEALASYYPAVAPVVEHFPVGLWEHMGQGRCRGTWAEDGSAYYFTVPHPLVPAFFALQRLAKLAEEKHAARKGEAQP